MKGASDGAVGGTWAHVCDPRPEPDRSARGSDGPVGLIVLHGMGQPVPFQTLEEVVGALREAERRAGRPVPEACVRRVELEVDGVVEPFNRVELRVGAPDTARDVHLYEAYWAPIPEGKVGGGDVIRFLMFALWHNRRLLGQRWYRRFLFGSMRSYEIRRLWTVVQLAGVAVAVGSLLIINSAVGLVSVAALLLNNAGGTWLSGELVHALLLDMAWLSIPFVLIGLGVSKIPGWIGPPPPGDPHAPRFSRASAAGWVFVIAGLATLAFVAGRVVYHMTGNGISNSPVSRGQVVGFAFAWLALLGISRVVRNVLVQYVGDVAAYISAHTVNRFWQVRSDIFRAAMRVGNAVYGARDGAGPAYRDVVIVGHSLGSLIAYDMLNGLLLDDYLAARRAEAPAAPASRAHEADPPLGEGPDPRPRRAPRRVRERTAALVTSGSPLDKVAFLFRIQQPMDAIVREVLANSIQPLILAPEFRPRRWVNIYSSNDLISARLDFYDPPADPTGGRDASDGTRPPRDGRVENLYDHAAHQPLLAHNQYWKNPLFGDLLRDVLAPESSP